MTKLRRKQDSSYPKVIPDCCALYTGSRISLEMEYRVHDNMVTIRITYKAKLASQVSRKKGLF